MTGRAGHGKVVCVVSGGNINLSTLSEILGA
jgi:threonine dehydratase